MAETIYWLATLLWSLVVLLALIVFRRPLGRLIRSAGNRDLQVRIADQDLSVAELARQQADLINDLQNQVSALRQRIGDLEANRWQADEHAEVHLAELIEAKPAPVPVAIPMQAVPEPERARLLAPQSQFPVPSGPPPWERVEAIAEPAATAPPPPPVVVEAAPAEPLPQPPFDQRPAPSGLLWVDDHPEHSAVQIDLLQRHQVMVHTARSTEEALENLRRRRYEMVVSGMVREENGKSIPNAGLELVRAIRMLDQDTPIAIYSNGQSAGMYGPMAKDAGANMLTGSWFELAEELRDRRLFPVTKPR
ncbi:MAG TPA: response regulator [Pseudonocardiaceae bacterium]|nr:response regulator [Pseudonocardiaceae bacterium]